MPWINIQAALEIIKAIYDAQPEAIEENRIVHKIQNYHEQVQSFINGELVYVYVLVKQKITTWWIWQPMMKWNNFHCT